MSPYGGRWEEEKWQCFVNVSQHVWCGRMRKRQSLRVNKLLLMCLWSLMLRAWANCVWWMNMVYAHASTVPGTCLSACSRVFLLVSSRRDRFHECDTWCGACCPGTPDWSPTTGWNTCADLSWCSEWLSSCWPTVLNILSHFPTKDRCLYANLRWASWTSACAVAQEGRTRDSSITRMIICVQSPSVCKFAWQT